MNVSPSFGSVIQYQNSLAQSENPLTSQSKGTVMETGLIKKGVTVQSASEDVGTAKKANSFRGVGQIIDMQA